MISTRSGKRQRFYMLKRDNIRKCGAGCGCKCMDVSILVCEHICMDVCIYASCWIVSGCYLDVVVMRTAVRNVW